MVVRMNSPSHLSLTRMTFTTEVEGNSTAALVSSVGAFFRSGKERKKVNSPEVKKERRKEGWKKRRKWEASSSGGHRLTKELGVGSVNTHKSCFGGRRQMKYVVASVGGPTTPHISIKYNTCVNARFLTIIYQTSAVLISVIM